jgi:outer membrane protein
MAIDAATPFEIETPAAENIFVEKLADLQPETVYTLAMANMPQQKFNDFKLKAAQRSSAAVKGSLYPTISIFGNLVSRYNSRSEEVASSTLINPAFGKVTVNALDYNVYRLDSFPYYTYRKQPFFSQLNQNFNQSVGLNLSIPIFNGLSARTNYQKSKISIRNQELQKDLDNQTLKQDIYKAYNGAMVALEKLNAGKKTLETAERTLYFAQKRYDVGMMGTFELITNQNNVFTAKLQNALNQYDYVFKMKVLEFYKGQGLKF